MNHTRTIRAATLLAALACSVPVPAAGPLAASPVDDLPVRVTPVGPGVSELRVGTTLEATLTREDADRTVEVSLGPGGTRLELLVRAASGRELLQASWHGGRVFAKLPSGEETLTAIHVEGFDCEAWRAAGWQQLLDRSRDEAVSGFDAATAAPPGESIEALSLVAMLADLTRLACTESSRPGTVRRRADLGAARGRDAAAAPGPADPEAAACYHDNRDSFSGCKACCEAETGLLRSACAVGGWYICRIVESDWCKGAAVGSCDSITTASESYCINSNCRGLPGDGACPEPKPPCPGLCMHFCGIGWDSACGGCPGPGDEISQRSCCA